MQAQHKLRRLPTLGSLPVGAVLSFNLKGRRGSISTVASEKDAAPIPRSPEGKAPNEPAHFLLYLTHKTFVGTIGDALAHEVRDALATGLPVVLVHETDIAHDGCTFDTFFKTTPEDLIRSGLYNALAEPFVGGVVHRHLSYALLAKKLGAKAVKVSLVGRLSARLSGTVVRRSSRPASAARIEDSVKDAPGPSSVTVSA